VTLQLCELESQMHPIKMLQYMSPQVASTLMWFLKEFSRSYLFMNEKKYSQVRVLFVIFIPNFNHKLILVSLVADTLFGLIGLSVSVPWELEIFFFYKFFFSKMIKKKK
jgi:hypothetical protein